MRIVLTVILAVHGLIHLLGVARALGLAGLPQLTRPVAPALGFVWALAAGLLLAAAVAVQVGPRVWWMLAAAGVVASTVAIVPAWADARAGMLVNLVVLVAVAFGFLSAGPTSLRAEYARDVDAGLARTADVTVEPVTDADLAPLPEPVQRYLRGAGVVGRPRVLNVRVRLHGRIRQGPDDPWMPIAAEQYDFFDEPSRFFYLTASRMGLPVQGYHRYAGAEATMRIRAAALVPVADASGAAMTRAETVTLFNDMCLLAPATLVDPAIAWDVRDAHTVGATFTNAGHTIHAELSFNDAGELVDFRSGDRTRASADGRTLTPMPWSTPMRASRTFGPFHLPTAGVGRWHAPAGAYDYIELTIDEVEYNRTRR